MVGQAQPATESDRFEKVKTDNPDVKKLQENLVKFMNETSQKLYIEDYEVKSGTNKIAHKNGQTPRGYVIIKMNSALTIYCEKIDKDFLYLNSSAGGIISLEVIK